MGRKFAGPSRTRLLTAVAAAAVLAPAAPALAADTTPPVISTAQFASPPDGNSNWRLTVPQTLNLAATDDVAVAQLQYSTDGGATYADAPITAGGSVSAAVELSQQGNTTLRIRAIDSSGNVSRGATVNTTLNQAAAAGANQIRLQSTTGRGPGDELVIGTGATSETVTIDALISPAPGTSPNVRLTTTLANSYPAGTPVAATPFYSTVAMLIDSYGPVATWATQPTTLAAAAAPGDAGVRFASLNGRTVGETLVLDQAENAETVQIAAIDAGAVAPSPNVTLTAPVQNAHLSGSFVYVPSIVDGQVLQSKTLTPLRSDPRRRDATDTVANGAGGSAIRRMLVDGEQVIPKPLPLNTLTVGRHTQAVALQDVAGSVAKYTNTFEVTTSFADLATVIDQYADNALRTTLNGASVVGATALRLQTPFGFRAGQTLVIDTGDAQETVTIDKVLSPPPTVNTTLGAAATAGTREIRLNSYTTSDRGRRERAEQQRADRRPADRARHGREPRGDPRRAAHHAGPGRARTERGAQRAAGEGPRGEPRRRTSRTSSSAHR